MTMYQWIIVGLMAIFILIFVIYQTKIFLTLRKLGYPRPPRGWVELTKSRIISIRKINDVGANESNKSGEDICYSAFVIIGAIEWRMRFEVNGCILIGYEIFGSTVDTKIPIFQEIKSSEKCQFIMSRQSL